MTSPLVCPGCLAISLIRFSRLRNVPFRVQFDMSGYRCHFHIEFLTVYPRPVVWETVLAFWIRLAGYDESSTVEPGLHLVPGRFFGNIMRVHGP